jgi:hypothetical protein
MDTVAVLLHAGTLTPVQREAVWKRGKRQNSYYVAFLEMCPDQLSGLEFTEACIDILSRPETQEVVTRTLDAIGRYFGQQDPATGASGERLEALNRLSQISSVLSDPIFARSTAIGSLMRRKIEPITKPILADLRQLK